MSQEQTGTTESLRTDVGYFDTANALQIRLNTDPVVKQFELDLRGLHEMVFVDENGEEKVVLETNGNPLANKLGQQAVMGHINSVVNHQNVQGNLKVDDQNDGYAEFLRRTRRGIAADLMENMGMFGIAENHYRGIINRMMRLIELITSRTINDGERNTFKKTTQISENSSSQVKESGRGIPFISK